MTIWFTSDTHFGHKAILHYTSRSTLWGVHDVYEHDEFLLNEWNDTIDPHDEVWHLGDFSFLKERATIEVMGKLHGRIHLVKGNHDSSSLRSHLPSNWTWEGPYVERKFGGRNYVLMHYPLAVWRGGGSGTWHLHGHTHGNYVDISTSMDVGVDTQEGQRIAYTLDDIEDHLGQIEYIPLDHHKAHT